MRTRERFTVSDSGIVDHGLGRVVCDPSPANAASAAFLNDNVRRGVLLDVEQCQKAQARR